MMKIKNAEAGILRMRKGVVPERWILICSPYCAVWNPPEMTSEDTVFLKILTINEIYKYLIFSGFFLGDYRKTL